MCYVEGEAGMEENACFKDTLSHLLVVVRVNFF